MVNQDNCYFYHIFLENQDYTVKKTFRNYSDCAYYAADNLSTSESIINQSSI